MYHTIAKLTVLITIILFTVACEKERDRSSSKTNSSNNEIPADTGGIQYAHPLDTSIAKYGHHLYIPAGYHSTEAHYPLLVFLHGSGERGNSAEDSTALNLVLRNGPPMLIERQQWNPINPMLVASPQCHTGWWNASDIHAFIGFIIREYRVNIRRIYLTGLSMGGFGTFTYLQTYSDTGFVAAAVPICGSGNPDRADRLLEIPLWAFHGDTDNTVPASGSMNMVHAINNLNPDLPAKLTIYPGVGHNSWSRTYDDSGMGTESPEYDPFDESIFDWMYRYTKRQEK